MINNFQNIRLRDLPNGTEILLASIEGYSSVTYYSEPSPHIMGDDMMPVDLLGNELNETDFFIIDKNQPNVTFIPSLNGPFHQIDDVFSYLYGNKQLSKFDNKESLSAYLEDGCRDEGLIWSMEYKGSILNAIKYIKQDDVTIKKAIKKFPILDESFISENKEWNELIPLAKVAVEICVEVEMEEWEYAIRDSVLNKEAVCRELVGFSKFFHNNLGEFSEVL